jgi:hypothetical protein
LAFRLGRKQDERRFAVDFQRFNGEAEALRQGGAVIFSSGRADRNSQVQQAADGDEEGLGVSQNERPHGGTPIEGSDERALASYDATHLVSILSQTAFCFAVMGRMIRAAETF